MLHEEQWMHGNLAKSNFTIRLKDHSKQKFVNQIKTGKTVRYVNVKALTLIEVLSSKRIQFMCKITDAGCSINHKRKFESIIIGLQIKWRAYQPLGQKTFFAIEASTNQAVNWTSLIKLILRETCDEPFCDEDENVLDQIVTIGHIDEAIEWIRV